VHKSTANRQTAGNSRYDVANGTQTTMWQHSAQLLFTARAVIFWEENLYLEKRNGLLHCSEQVVRKFT